MNQNHDKYSENTSSVFHITYSKLPEIPIYINDLSLAKELIRQIFPSLNRLHNIDKPYEYWIKLILPHTQLWIEKVYDRFCSLESDQGQKSSKNYFFDPQDQEEDIFNKNLIKDILEIKNIKLITNFDLYNSNEFHKVQKNKISVFFASFLRRALARLQLVFSCEIIQIIRFRFFLLQNLLIYLGYNLKSKERNGYILQPFLSRKRFKNLLTLIKFNDIHYFPSLKLPTIFIKRRDASKFRSAHIEFEFACEKKDFINFLRVKSLKYLPGYAVEEFSSYSTYFEKFSCNTLICKCPVSLEPSLRHAFAALSSKAKRIIAFQHGGGYGLFDLGIENMEYQFVDDFVCWTDSSTESKRGLVVGSRLENSDKNNPKIVHQNEVLVIAPSFKKYHRSNFALHPFFNSLVQERIINLISLLKDNGFNVVYRPYAGKKDQITKILGLTIENNTITQQIRNAEFVVLCAPFTPPTESLLEGKLPFLFWGEEYTFTDSSQELLNKISSYGFVASDPDSCYGLISTLKSKSFSEHQFKIIFDNFSKLFGSHLASNEDILGIIQDPNLSGFKDYNIKQFKRVSS